MKCQKTLITILTNIQFRGTKNRDPIRKQGQRGSYIVYTRSIVAGATWIWITCFGGAAGRGPKNKTKP